MGPWHQALVTRCGGAGGAGGLGGGALVGLAFEGDGFGGGGEQVGIAGERVQAKEREGDAGGAVGEADLVRAAGSRPRAVAGGSGGAAGEEMVGAEAGGGEDRGIAQLGVEREEAEEEAGGAAHDVEDVVAGEGRGVEHGQDVAGFLGERGFGEERAGFRECVEDGAEAEGAAEAGGAGDQVELGGTGERLAQRLQGGEGEVAELLPASDVMKSAEKHGDAGGAVVEAEADLQDAVALGVGEELRGDPGEAAVAAADGVGDDLPREGFGGGEEMRGFVVCGGRAGVRNSGGGPTGGGDGFGDAAAVESALDQRNLSRQVGFAEMAQAGEDAREGRSGGRRGYAFVGYDEAGRAGFAGEIRDVTALEAFAFGVPKGLECRGQVR